MSFAADPRPIGVFDSGVGGLTVLKALMDAMPGQSFIYLGDTARVPYGTKSAETVRTYALSLTRLLLAHDVKMIVIACNTASAHATLAVTALAGGIPVIGMVEPAVEAAAGLDARRILLMATQSTVQAGAYERTLKLRCPDAAVDARACQVLVALAEEGWTDNAAARAALDTYIGDVFKDAENAPDTIILGCTHFPLLRDAIVAVAGDRVRIVDSGQAGAAMIARQYGPFSDNTPRVRFYVTDSVERFLKVAQRFLQRPDVVIEAEQIDLTDFGHQTPCKGRLVG